ncbi:MAG: recombinase A [Bradymonadaceae bacterium]
MTTLADIEGVARASQLEQRRDRAREEQWWSPEALAGRLVELSADRRGASLTFAFDLVRACQAEGEPAAWVGLEGSGFYPPDAERFGVDLEALPVVRAADAGGAVRAADRLVRSGGFGAVTVDLAGEEGAGEGLATPLQKRLQRHAEEREAAVLFLTRKRKGARSLGPLISLRGTTRRERRGRDRFACEIEVSADDRRGPGGVHEEVYRGPPGLR